MTTAPARPLLHAYEGADPWEIIPSPYGPGTDYRWRVDSIRRGETSGLAEISAHLRDDAVAKIADLDARQSALDQREQELTARELALNATAAKFVDFVGRSAALFDRLEQHRADQEREAEHPLTLPPGSANDPSKEPELAPEDDTHIPGGELHDVPAKAPDPEEFNGDPRGEYLRLKHPVTTDQTEPDLPRPPAEQQPIAAGLDDAEEFEEEKHGD